VLTAAKRSEIEVQDQEYRKGNRTTSRVTSFSKREGVIPDPARNDLRDSDRRDDSEHSRSNAEASGNFWNPIASRNTFMNTGTTRHRLTRKTAIEPTGQRFKERPHLHRTITNPNKAYFHTPKYCCEFCYRPSRDPRGNPLSDPGTHHWFTYTLQFISLTQTDPRPNKRYRTNWTEFKRRSSIYYDSEEKELYHSVPESPVPAIYTLWLHRSPRTITNSD
jgi:hypothetical protein